MLKRWVCVACMAITMAMLMGCATIAARDGVSEIREELDEKASWGSPKTHALYFGTEGTSINTFLQQNPQFGYVFYPAVVMENVTFWLQLIPAGSFRYFLAPQPVGAELKLYTSEEYYSNGSMTTVYGIGGVDIIVDKPGLIYMGKEDKNNKEELKTLKKMVDYFEGSEWEIYITQRIQEIENVQE